MRSIAVLPFHNMSADPENEYFSDGMTEEIITRLSKIRELRVASRSTVLRYKGSGIDPREVGRELGVGSVLAEGSVRKVGNRVRITAQLINAADGFHLCSEVYDRNLDDVFKIQDEVSERIAEVLRLNLTAAERFSSQPFPLRASRPTTTTPAAGTFSISTREQDTDPPSTCLKALELDPNYALAYAGLSVCYAFFINRGWDETATWLDKAQEAAIKALAIDQTLPEAHFALGFYYEMKEDWDREESHETSPPLGS